MGQLHISNLLLAAAVLLILHSCSSRTWACTCGDLGEDASTLAEYSDVVFLGEVTVGARPDDSSLPARYVISVFEVWKGSVFEKQILLNAIGCEEVLYEGEVYLVFTSRSEGGFYRDDLVISRCSPSFELSAADILLEDLGLGEPPLAGASDAPMCGLAGILPWFLMCSVLLSIRLKRSSGDIIQWR